jgi:putative ABC transport system ATP-binding protein
VIEVFELVKVYSTGRIELEALKGITIRIEDGEYAAIMGPSGSGKSTFMNILGCLDRMTSGKYCLDGDDVSLLSDRELAHIRNKRIGFVFQAFNLLPRLNALENIEVPMLYGGIGWRERRRRAMEALCKVGLEDRADHKPSELSGGQRQKAAIARAIVNDPSVIMADEPTGNLDTKSSTDIMKIFQKLNDEGRTVVMVTHENDIAKHTRRLISFRDGEICGDSPVDDRIVYNSDNN